MCCISSSEVEWGGLHGLQAESLEFTWIPSGCQVEVDNNLAGLPAKKNHMDSMWTMWISWIPCGFHLESMGESKVLQFLVKLLEF